MNKIFDENIFFIIVISLKGQNTKEKLLQEEIINVDDDEKNVKE